MTEHSLWRFSHAFHRAINETTFEDIAALLDDDIEWALLGPVDLFSFFGERRGRTAVLEVMRQVADNFAFRRFYRESVVLGADSVASMIRYSLTSLDSNKPISVRIAYFVQFRDCLLIRLRVMVDSFDLIEQAVGYSVHLPPVGAAQ